MRPALDLLAQVPDGLPAGEVVDLGCGAGAAGPALRARYGDRTLVGLDASPAMLAEAAATGCYDRLVEGDIARWQPEAAPALIFSNAALQWVPDHAALLPQLAALPAPDGVLAVQVPDQQDAPSHRLLREVAAALCPGRFDGTGRAIAVLPPERIFALLAPFGAVS
ncbi:MAG: methyltransferase domain-containing protein, partial [Mangrovicoccus sp.]|nr:methyltransferase domain-containing protein [Mangrovicoccus sp.]